MGIQVIADTDTVSKQEVYGQIMFEIQKRMVDIENNREQKAPIDNEIADMVLLTKKLLETENVENSVVSQRKNIIEKIFS